MTPIALVILARVCAANAQSSGQSDPPTNYSAFSLYKDSLVGGRDHTFRVKKDEERLKRGKRLSLLDLPLRWILMHRNCCTFM